METFENILVVSRSTQHCIRVLRKGISLARKYGASLHILHIIHDPFSINGWNLPIPSLDEEYKKMAAKARQEIDRMVRAEQAEGLVIAEWVKDGNPADAIQSTVESQKVD